jgi:hypothetical protein
VRTKRGTRLEWRDHEGRLDGVNERHVRVNGKWHRARARGMREHVERVEECGTTKEIHTACPSCGAEHVEPGGCGSRLLCSTCRGKKNAQARRVFLAARDVALDRAHAAGVDDRGRHGGAFTEKFLTLTLPHLAEHGITERIALAFGAWTYFLRRFNDWLRAERDAEHVAWFRRFEWTQCDGAKSTCRCGKGHPHFHIWFFGPFLPARPQDGLELQRWWCEALDAAARDLGIVAPNLAPDEVSIDVQGDVRDVERELVKYLVKEIADGEYVAPERYARVWEALDGRRVTQASNGFTRSGTEALAQTRTCRECHEPVDRYRVAVREVPGYTMQVPKDWDPRAADLALARGTEAMLVAMARRELAHVSDSDDDVAAVVGKMRRVAGDPAALLATVTREVAAVGEAFWAHMRDVREARRAAEAQDWRLRQPSVLDALLEDEREVWLARVKARALEDGRTRGGP